jgi:predicted transcriptional regulator
LNFYEIYKRKGTNATLFALYSAKNYSCTLPEFFEKLEFEENSYYNAFFRVKNDLLSLGLIECKRNRNKEKIIKLTPKGVKIVRILKEIRVLFNRDYDLVEEEITQVE